jgi:hypothetical protein
MKNTLLILLVTASISAAATINVGNLNDPNTSNGITLKNGTLVTVGSAQVGFFNGIADANVASSTLSTLVAAFTPYGNLVTFGAGFAPPAPALFAGTVNGDPLAAPFSGKSFYLMLTNSALGFTAAGVTGAGEALVWSNGEAFPAADPFTTSINLQAGQGTLIKGGFNNSSITFTDFGGTVAVAAYNMEVIPEPSAALLGAVGALGLLRRRRN